MSPAPGNPQPSHSICLSPWVAAGLPYDFRGFVSLDSFRSQIPRRNTPIRPEHEHRIILHIFDELPEWLFIALRVCLGQDAPSNFEFLQTIALHIESGTWGSLTECRKLLNERIQENAYVATDTKRIPRIILAVQQAGDEELNE